MSSFRGRFLLLALGLTAMQFVHAQTPDSSSAPATQQAPESAPAQPQASVQARIKARREQRRAAAIREVYDHLYDGYVGAGFVRTHAGPPQKVNMYDWNGGFTRYFGERLGVTLDGRGYYGTAFTGYTPEGIFNPAISEYSVLMGPSYRFYIQPRYSISGRVMAGYAQGNFSGDTNGDGGPALGLYKDGATYAASASVFAEYNVSPGLGVRLAPEYFLTGFGSTQQNSLGFTAGLVYRVGKQ
jgi:hypothetical protein